MDDLDKLTKEQIMAELITTRQRIKDLEQQNQVLIKELNGCKEKFSQALKAKERALKLAEIDYLTGLLNRRAFIKRLEGELNRSKRAGVPLSLIFADIDHFKFVNDTYGHIVGDLVLRRFARLLVKMCRNYDFICRYGGEEFLICLPDTSLKRAYIIAERISDTLASWNVELSDGRKVTITSSFGVTASSLDKNETVKHLIEKVDEALYRAKRNGRNRVEAY